MDKVELKSALRMNTDGRLAQKFAESCPSQQSQASRCSGYGRGYGGQHAQQSCKSKGAGGRIFFKMFLDQKCRQEHGHEACRNSHYPNWRDEIENCPKTI